MVKNMLYEPERKKENNGSAVNYFPKRGIRGGLLVSTCHMLPNDKTHSLVCPHAKHVIPLSYR